VTNLAIWDFFEKKYVNALADRKKNCIVAEKNFCCHRLEKKYIALLNLSRQCIVFMEKYISVPHDREKNVLLSFS
jgi:hypothetical protein